MQGMSIHHSTAGVPLPGTATIGPGDAVVVGFYSIACAYCVEIMYRCIFLKMDTGNRLIRLTKVVMALSFFIKSVLFMTFNTSTVIDCNSSIRTADFFYHFGVTAGVCVLLLRLRAVLPVGFRFHLTIFHIGIALFRLVIGIIDVILIDFEAPSQSLCVYLESSVWGPVYTFMDTTIDLYVTIMIGYFLSRHIYRLHATQTQGNIPSYIGIVIQNILRTVILTVVNLASAIFILKGNSAYGIMVIWPIVNTLFVLLIGYDADLAQAMRQLHFTVCQHRLPPPQPTAMMHPQGGNNNGDPFTTVSSECPYCGRRRSDESATAAALDDEWPRPSSRRQRAVSATPSFLAATTITSMDSNGDSESQETAHSPSYLSAFQTLCHEDPTADIPSSHCRQFSSSDKTSTSPLCDECLLAPSIPHLPSPTLPRHNHGNCGHCAGHLNSAPLLAGSLDQQRYHYAKNKRL